MKKEIQEKIKNCKALQGMTIADIMISQRFLNNLDAYMRAQREDRSNIQASYNAMKALGGSKSYKLPSHPIDKVINLPVQDFALEYLNVIRGVSTRPAAQREYVRQLGQQAYYLTISQIVCEEYPELESELLPKSEAN